MMHREIGVLFAEMLVLSIRVRITLDTKPRAIDIMLLLDFMQYIVELYRLGRDGDLGNNSRKPLQQPDLG